MSRQQYRVNARVRIENLGHQEIKLPKTTALGVARETSTSFVAADDSEEILNSRLSKKANRGANTAVVEASSLNMQTASTHQTLSTALVLAEQKTDKFCSIIKVGKTKEKSEYFYDEGVVYRRRTNGEHQLVFPKNLVREVIAMNHSPNSEAHLVQKRTLENLCSCYYWPGMRQDVQNYIRQCNSYANRKPTHLRRGPSIMRWHTPAPDSS
jgi:hypothetical protein